MMGDKFWSELRATIAGLNKKPMVKTASAKDPNRVAVAEAKASGFFVKAKAMGWGLYQVEELDGGLGSIWHVEKDAATGEQFLVKQVDPVGDIVRRVKTAAAGTVKVAAVPADTCECGCRKSEHKVVYNEETDREEVCGKSACKECLCRGYRFWLTRNHHGAGFWDGDYPKEIGEALTKLSHEFGETDAYVGDDGKLHLL
jgi:hypothetical protein